MRLDPCHALQQAELHAYICFQGTPGVVLGGRNEWLCCQVKDGVGLGLFQDKGYHFEPRQFSWIEFQLVAQVGDVAIRPENRARYFPIGGLEQVFGQMAAHEAGNARDECFQAALQRLGPPGPRKIARYYTLLWGSSQRQATSRPASLQGPDLQGLLLMHKPGLIRVSPPARACCGGQNPGGLMSSNNKTTPNQPTRHHCGHGRLVL